MKICNKCNIEKELDCFYNKKNICKCCKKKYIKTNAIKIADYKKQYQKANAVKLAENKKEYNKTNAIKIAENKKQYQKANAVKIIEYNKKYKKDNAVKIIEYKNKYNKTKRKSDPIFRLKLNVSISINKYLKKKDLSKNNESCLQHIPYSITELKIYIESLFEPWMNWNNQGMYKVNDWNDNDQSTWKWNLDHIIPHSTFNYISMDSQEFRDCWSLSNLRPLSAKQNILDGARS